MEKSKRILVTGGAGFIGSHLCERLLEEGHAVICLDNFYTGRKENISGLLKNKKFKLVSQDVCEPYFAKVDQIYNLACPASPPHYQKDPIFTTKTSFLGAVNMLELAQKTGARILEASTSEIYGDPDVHPQPEHYHGYVSPIGVRSCYDEGKRISETLFMDYHRSRGVNIRIARIFNTYGPNMDPLDGRVVSNFIVQALTNNDLTVFGNGKQTRSFMYIDDLIDSLLKMMNNKNSFIGPVNLGNPREFTVKELAEKVLKAIPESKSKIVYKKLPLDDPKQRKPDIALAKRKLKWEPKVDLEEGLILTIKYFREIIKKDIKALVG